MLALLLPYIYLGAQEYPPGYENESSDWWSRYSDNSQTTNVKAQHRLPAISNLRILDISLGSLDSDQSRDFRRVIGKLGEATVIGRGDASTGRRQICYLSAAGSERVHLIFEEGELDDSFYLFAGGPDWTGSDRCVSSKLVSAALRTASGMHLGQTRQQVLMMLGRPSVSDNSKLVYSFEIQQRMTPEEIKKMRQQDPGAREEDFIFFVSVHIEARFANSKLNYLAVSKSEFD